MKLIYIHRALAVLLGVFILTHLAVHVSALWGVKAHVAALGAIQDVYRNPIVEPILIISVVSQIYVGARLLARRWKETGKGLWSWIQLVSGIYLAVFLTAHFSAALAARHLAGVDTNFYWPAGTLVLSPLKYGFAPYYTLGVTAVFAHLGAALYFAAPKVGRFAAPILAGFGVVFGASLVWVFGGGLYDIQLSPEHQRYFQAFYPTEPAQADR